MNAELGQYTQLTPTPTQRKYCDWAAAKDLYCNGATAKEVAKHIGASVLTVQKRASQEKWGKDRIATRDGLRVAAPSSLTHYLNAQVDVWVRGAVRLLQKLTDLAHRTPVKPDIRQLREASATLESIVRSGRAMFGLDKEQTVAPRQLAVVNVGSVNYLGQGALAPQAQPASDVVIDTQPLTEIEKMTANQQAEPATGQERDSLDAPAAGDAGGGPPFRPLDINKDDALGAARPDIDPHRQHRAPSRLWSC